MITGKTLQFVEKHFGELKTLSDNDAKAIVEEIEDVDVSKAWWDDEESIYYEVAEEEETDNEEYIPRGWNERYLNSIGMSMSDFV